MDISIPTKPPDPHKTRKKRSDVAKRKEDNKDTDFVCVKMSWNSLVKDNYLKHGIQQIVYNVNKISFLSYKLLNFHFTRLLENKLPLPDLTQNLFYNACSTVSVMKNRKAVIDIEDQLYKSSFMLFKYFIDDKDLPFRDKMGNLINNLNRQQITMAKNHIKLNFYKRFTKYLELKTGETRKNIIYLWCKDIYKENYDGKNPFILSMRQWLRYPPTEENVGKYSAHFLTVYHKIQKEFERYPNTKGIRSFSLLPNKSSFTMDSIQICTSCLGDIISYLTDKPNLKDLSEKKREYWCSLFNIKTYETSTKKFHYSIFTDGKVGVIAMSKPKSKDIKLTKNTGKNYENYVGIDPGVCSLFMSCNEKDEVLKCSTREYRHHSKMIYGCKKREQWYKKWEHYNSWKRIPSFKVSSTVEMTKYFEYVLPNLDVYFSFHCEKNFRGLSFTSYCRSKSTLERICRKITGGKKTLVGFGDFSQQHGLVKKHPATPILKLKNQLRRYCDVVEIDEWGTSKTCHRCFGKVELYRNKKTYMYRPSGHTEKVKKTVISTYRRVIRCSSNECTLCCMDRDINASKNMLFLLQCQRDGVMRPSCFSPKKEEDSLSISTDDTSLE
jgi:hypothetical protein